MSSPPELTLPPELEAILDKIGWATVKERAPAVAEIWERFLTPNAGGFAPDPVRARATLKCFEKLASAIDRVLAQLNSLTSKEVSDLNTACQLDTSLEEIFRPPPDSVAAVKQGLERLRAGLTPPHLFLEWEADQSKKGRPRNEVAYKIARILAHIYVVGRGDLPTYGRDAITNEPNGDFVPTVVEVYRILEVEVGDPIDPCKAAIKSITAPIFELLKIHRNGSDPVAVEEWGKFWNSVLVK